MSVVATVPQQKALSIQDRARADAFDHSGHQNVILHLAGRGDDVAAWWTPHRDKDLDMFWKSESLLAGAVYSIAAKVASLPWTLKGPERQVRRYQEMFVESELGGGWVSLIFKFAEDLLTQDNGGFIEILREPGQSEDVPAAGLAHLDARRCTRTSDPIYPVVYDSFKTGKQHKLKWWQVLSIADMPSPREEMKGVGFCAVSRVLRAAQTLRDIATYKHQKLSGKRAPAFMFVQGMRRGALKENIDTVMREQRDRGFSHWTAPIPIASPDPAVPLRVQLVELAGLPDGYDEETTFKWYVAQLALGFGVDYGEFAPLPGAALGTATQSVVQAEKARGKGPGSLLHALEHAINWSGILPRSVSFTFSSKDSREERETAEISELRARTIKQLIESGALTPEAAIQVLADWGEVPQAFISTDITEDVSATDNVPLEYQNRGALQGAYSTNPANANGNTSVGNVTGERQQEQGGNQQ
jgi:hypothetical protein